MIRAEWFFWLVGAVFLVMAVQMAFDRTNPKRYTTAAFWGLLGAAFIYSTWVLTKKASPELLGAGVLVMAGLGGFGLTGRGRVDTTTREQRLASARRYGSRLFIPALTIPVVAVLCATVVKNITINGRPILEPKQETILGLGIGTIVALVVAMVMLRERRVATPLHDGRGMLEAIGWAALLPQLLATLGVLFTVAGVGTVIGRLSGHVLPDDKYIAVGVYCLGMALFTVVMGNAFAAFPVMTAAIGWPVLVQQGHGNPVVVLAVGMLAGFCGTLTTPMAANFNIVPAALLELKDQYGPIKAQIPTAIPLLACNIAIMSIFAF